MIYFCTLPVCLPGCILCSSGVVLFLKSSAVMHPSGWSSQEEDHIFRPVNRDLYCAKEPLFSGDKHLKCCSSYAPLVRAFKSGASQSGNRKLCRELEDF